MISVIVPVFSQADLQALPNCLQWLASRPEIENLLVLHGPNVGIVAADVTKEFDDKIAALDVRKRELTLVEDFSGAQKAKEEIETLKIDRDIAVRDGWKKVPEEQRKSMYKKAFGDIGTEPWCLREAYSWDQVFTLLQAFLAQLPSDFKLGEFSIVAPRSIAPMAQAVAPVPAPALPPVHRIQPKPAKVRPVNATDRESRRAQLRASQFMGIRAAAIKHGVYQQGKSTNDLLDAILDKEFPEPVTA